MPACSGLCGDPCPKLSFQVPGRGGLMTKPKSGPFRLCRGTQNTAGLGCSAGAAPVQKRFGCRTASPPRCRYSLHLTSSACELLFIHQNPLPPALPLCGFPVFVTHFLRFLWPLASLYPNPITLGGCAHVHACLRHQTSLP